MAVKTVCAFLDQELISYRYLSSCSGSYHWSDLFKKVRLCCFKSDRDEIWHDCSSKYALIDGVAFLI